MSEHALRAVAKLPEPVYFLCDQDGKLIDPDDAERCLAAGEDVFLVDLSWILYQTTKEATRLDREATLAERRVKGLARNSMGWVDHPGAVRALDAESNRLCYGNASDS